MVSYKGEYFIHGVDEKKRPDIVFQIRMKEKIQREQWPRCSINQTFASNFFCSEIG